MSVNNRINDLILKKNMSRVKFAESIGIPTATIQNIVGSRKSSPSSEVLEKILQRFPDVDANWLLSGKSKNLTNSNELESETNSNKSTSSNQNELLKMLIEENNFLKENNERMKKLLYGEAYSTLQPGKLIGSQIHHLAQGNNAYYMAL
ncbi:helix-turn-helix domain-containing protein [Aureibacter tunicatorum]|uniref:Transcriptional regulator with XRE-family HTH domain n=1 Tax=Aureibacter tunicatorum TaxID=866807 RepID=A0AAE3XS32_9BACT|nr:helix-turn-helix transcriptional regulator [Aureibacter tunicatorum]MDR6240945.1 transcriptional regulator with XRE-family HTH domain [Aureibacter tunicatorum]BDD03725.1 hypothetical protein AUTU_12080 [Aureibacter tunicatorum]